MSLRLGVNIDHVATVRNARGGKHPSPLRAAFLAEKAGADGITAHLREDRRHISDEDILRLRNKISLPLNLEMAATSEMSEIALAHNPHACCIVPEKRQELTTEGGLDVIGEKKHLQEFIKPLRHAGIRVSLFINPDNTQIECAKEIHADVVELHTGSLCHAHHAGDKLAFSTELARIEKAAEQADKLGLEVHAGHGLDFDTVMPIANIEQIMELNIGHFLIGEGIFCGLENSIIRMRSLMDKAREKKVSA